MTDLKWDIKIENRPNQRIRIEYSPSIDTVYIMGEYKPKNRKWQLFSTVLHEGHIDLDLLQEKMEIVIVEMRKRIEEYKNLDKGFSVLKIIAVEGDEPIEDDFQQV